MTTEMGQPVGSSFGEHPPAVERRESAIRLRCPPNGGAEVDDSQLRAALETSRQPLLIVDAENRICFANFCAAQLLQQSVEHLSRRYLQDYVVALEESDEVDQDRSRRMLPKPRVFEVALPNGRHATATQRLLPDRWGRPSHACIELEEHTPATSESTLESVGRLAGELAHDINNQLSAALNYVFVLQRRLGRSGACVPHLDGLHAAAWQAASLANGLKLVARKRSLQAEWLQLDEVVATLLPLLRHLAGDGRVELRSERGLPRVHVPLAYLEQLIVMLMLSSIKRAPAGSTLVLGTSVLRGPSDATAKVRLA